MDDEKAEELLFSANFACLPICGFVYARAGTASVLIQQPGEAPARLS